MPRPLALLLALWLAGCDSWVMLGDHRNCTAEQATRVESWIAQCRADVMQHFKELAPMTWYETRSDCLIEAKRIHCQQAAAR